MKKVISTAISFILIWAIAFGLVLLVSILTGHHDTHGWEYYLTIGFGGAMGGLLGPKISDYITGKLKKS